MTKEFEPGTEPTIIEMREHIDESSMSVLESDALNIVEMVDGISPATDLELTTDGNVVVDEGIFVEENAFVFLSVLSLLSKAYLMGRGDQIADLYSSSFPRAVKAKDLGNTIKMAMFFNEPEVVERTMAEKEEILDTFAGLRGVLNPRGVAFVGPDEESDKALSELMEKQSIGVVIPSLRKNTYHHLGFFGGPEIEE